MTRAPAARGRLPWGLRHPLTLSPGPSVAQGWAEQTGTACLLWGHRSGCHSVPVRRGARAFRKHVGGGAHTQENEQSFPPIGGVGHPALCPSQPEHTFQRGSGRRSPLRAGMQPTGTAWPSAADGHRPPPRCAHRQEEVKAGHPGTKGLHGPWLPVTPVTEQRRPKR